MARWKLTAPHYLNVPGTEWEFVEVDTGTGKQVRHRHPVGLYLSPDDPGDQNRQGEVVVCHEGKGLAGDRIFIGPPTPEMEPLDDEARAITDKMRPLWNNFSGSYGYGEGVLNDFQNQLTRAAMAQEPSNRKEIDDLKEQMAELQKQNAELARKVAGRRA